MGESCVPGAGLGTPLKHGELLVVRFLQGFLRPGGESGPQRVLCSEQHLLGAGGCGSGTRPLCCTENLLEGVVEFQLGKPLK